MPSHIRHIALLIFFSLISWPVKAADPVFLELSASGNRLNLGLAEFGTSRAKVEEAALAREIRQVVKHDLLFPRLFNLVEGGLAPIKRRVDTASWEVLGVDVLVTGQVNTGWFGKIRFTGALYDINTGQKIMEKKYTVKTNEQRQVAHQWANEIIGYFSGKPGITHSRIVFINDSTGHKEVCLVDYDGENFQRLTNDKSIALFPKLSPDGKWIVYTSYLQGSSDLYKISTEGQQKQRFCYYEGLNASACWFPDSASLVATLSKGRSPNLYVINLEGKIFQALTNSSSIDTAPSLSPNGRHLAFTSDRPGNPQIYTMDVNGANIKRLTDSGQCDSPSWSPQGHLVAYTKSEFDGNYDIFAMEVGPKRETRLTWGEGDNEDPAWSPDGRYIVFTSTRRGRAELWIMGADGTLPRPVGNIPGNSFTPHWGK